MEANVPDLDEFIARYKLPPLVPLKRSCEIAGFGLTKLYELAGNGEIRIVKLGKSSRVPAEDLYCGYLRSLQNIKSQNLK